MEQIKNIEDNVLGILEGRDCIYIDSVVFDDYNLVFKGEINGLLARKINKDISIPYELTFKNAMVHFCCEIDTYENIDEGKSFGYSDFNIVNNSKWLEQLPIRKDFDKSQYNHYQVFTYDYIYNIIAKEYTFNCNLENEKDMIE